jgi:hypothetical protein
MFSRSLIDFISTAKRNSLGKDRLYLRQGNSAFDFFKGLYEEGGSQEVLTLRRGVSPEMDCALRILQTTGYVLSYQIRGQI